MTDADLAGRIADLLESTESDLRVALTKNTAIRVVDADGRTFWVEVSSDVTSKPIPIFEAPTADAPRGSILGSPIESDFHLDDDGEEQ